MPIYDVVAAGGGPAGIGAAIGAGRFGKRVAIIERHPYVGGMGTAALVNNFCSAHKYQQVKKVMSQAVVGFIWVGHQFTVNP